MTSQRWWRLATGETAPVGLVRVVLAEPGRYTPLLGRAASASETVVNAPAVIENAETGEPLAAVGRYTGDVGALRRAFRAYPVTAGGTIRKGAGISNRSAVFGNVARAVHMKREGCRECNTAHQAPAAHAEILRAGANMAAELDVLVPGHSTEDRKTAGTDIDRGWLIEGTPWTSGVLNETSPLPYHYDRNNLRTWSSMVVVRRNVTGGHLHIPELGVTLACRDGDTVHFPGWQYMHGVTPMERTAADGYRHTAVFYTVRGFADCLPPDQEMRRARQSRSAREDTLLDRQEASGLRTPAPATGRAAIAEVTDLTAGLDFRQPEYRRETFLRFYDFHLRNRSHPGCVYFLMPYLRDRLGWGPEEALWFAFLNGNTQHPPSSLMLHRRFPTPAHADDLLAWWDANHARVPVDADRHRPKQLIRRAVPAYVRMVGASQQDFWEAQAEQGFGAVWGAARSIPGFGRLSAFSYAEYLRIMGVPVVCDTLFLDDIGGSRSHRNGLCKVLGRDDLDWHDDNPAFDGVYRPEIIDWLEHEASLLLADAQARNPEADLFTLESALCTYKSWHRPNHLRYPNVYADMLHDRLTQFARDLPAENVDIFWEARQECLPTYLRVEDNPSDPGNVPAKAGHYLRTGQPVMLPPRLGLLRRLHDTFGRPESPRFRPVIVSSRKWSPHSRGLPAPSPHARDEM